MHIPSLKNPKKRALVTWIAVRGLGAVMVAIQIVASSIFLWKFAKKLKNLNYVPLLRLIIAICSCTFQSRKQLGYLL